MPLPGRALAATAGDSNVAWPVTGRPYTVFHFEERVLAAAREGPRT